MSKLRGTDRWNAIIPLQLAAAPWEKSTLVLHLVLYFADESVVHASEIPYVWGQASTAAINESLDIALSRQIQKGWISFASKLNPNSLGDLSPGVRWPRYQKHSENVLVFQRPDGSGEQANGTAGTPVGQGLHKEKDPDDREICDFYAANDAAFVH